jgi:hypothetical protein
MVICILKASAASCLNCKFQITNRELPGCYDEARESDRLANWPRF